MRQVRNRSSVRGDSAQRWIPGLAPRPWVKVAVLGFHAVLTEKIILAIFSSSPSILRNSPKVNMYAQMPEMRAVGDTQ